MKVSHQFHCLLALFCIHSASFAAAPASQPAKSTCPCDFSKAAFSAIIAGLKDGMVICSASQSVRLSSAPGHAQKKPGSSQAITFINNPPITSRNIPNAPQVVWSLMADYDSNHGMSDNSYWFCSTQASDPTKSHSINKLVDYSGCQNDLDVAARSVGILCQS